MDLVALRQRLSQAGDMAWRLLCGLARESARGREEAALENLWGHATGESACRAGFRAFERCVRAFRGLVREGVLAERATTVGTWWSFTDAGEALRRKLPTPPGVRGNKGRDDLSTHDHCPQCRGHLFKVRSGWRCAYDGSAWEPTTVECPACGTESWLRQGDGYGCPKCRHRFDRSAPDR